MKTLVIHPDDHTTYFLSVIYQNTGWTIVTKNVSKKILTEQIKTHDRIIMLGHGTDSGLLGFKHLVIDSRWVYLLRNKQCVCIWCNADKFVEKYNLTGIYTGMIVSEYEEALMYCMQTNYDQIKESNILFANAVKSVIDDSINVIDDFKKIYNSNSNPVIQFNSNNIFIK